MAQIRFVTARFLLLLVAVPSVLQAAPIEDRSINKSVKDFPEKADLSSPESAMAAWCRAVARNDIEAMPDLTWVWLDPQAAGLSVDPVPAATAEKMLNTKVIKVLTYREDLAAVIVTGGLSPGDRPYLLMPFGRIGGQWKSAPVDHRKQKDLSYKSSSVEAAEEHFEKEKDNLWRFFTQIRDDVKNGRRASPLSAKRLEQIKRWQDKTWAINIQLDMPTLEPQAIQYAILDKDPAPKYTAHIKEMQKFNRQQLQEADTEEWKKLVRAAQLEGDWNHAVFRDVTGDNLSMLTPPGRVVTAAWFTFTAEKKRGDAADATKTRAPVSDAPTGKKWIVTKTVRINGEPVCWSIPVEVKIGKPVYVTLNKSNTFNLH
jgi:hypothetical protein